MITNRNVFLLLYSDCWGDSQFCSLCICTGYSSDTFGSSKYYFQVSVSTMPISLSRCTCIKQRCFLKTETVLCSAVLAHFILEEKLHMFGILGCVLCVVGSTTIVLHAPHEQDIESVKQVWHLATEPGIHSYKGLFVLVKLQ